MSTISILETREKRRGALIIAMLLLIIAAAAVVGLGWLAPANRGGGATVADNPRAVWAAQAANHYRYTVQVSCFCVREMTRPAVVEVRDGALVSLTYADDGTPADPALFERFTSVEKLFAVIDEAAAQDPVQLDVEYHATLGVPTLVNINISDLMADEELYFTVSDVATLP